MPRRDGRWRRAMATDGRTEGRPCAGVWCFTYTAMNHNESHGGYTGGRGMTDRWRRVVDRGRMR